MSIPSVILAGFLVVGLPVAAVAQNERTAEATQLLEGTYSNGFRYVQLAQANDRVCMATFFDRVGQAAALDQTLEQIRQEAVAAEAELERILRQQMSEQRQQMMALLADDALLSRAIANSQITAEQAEQIERFRNDPGALDQSLEEQVNDARQAARAEIEQRRIAVETELSETANAAANFQFFQGITSVVPTSLLNIYATAAADIVLLPQANGLVLVGEPNRLVNYVPIDDGVQDYPNLLASSDMQTCLAAQEPFRIELTELVGP
ncbi:MAG: hypothetical protein AAFR15_19125 [Cyanobacteria bacterium J06627_15]